MCSYPWGTPVKLWKYTAPQGIDSFLDFSGELRKFWCLQRERRNIWASQYHHNKYRKQDQNLKVQHFRA